MCSTISLCAEEQDNYVLSKLLRRSGVHSAVRHDAIVEGDGDDYVLIEGEAERVAREAVDSLPRSQTRTGPPPGYYSPPSSWPWPRTSAWPRPRCSPSTWARPPPP